MSVNLVVGATGSLGGHVTRGLLQQGKAVRILTRKNPLSEELANEVHARLRAQQVRFRAVLPPG